MISIIIPTYNEAKKISFIVNYLLDAADKKYIYEIIIADGGSVDDTILIAEKLPVKIVVVKNRNRPSQCNAAAAVARGEILFFLHADSVPPKNFAMQIINAVHNNYYCGCFRLSFDHNHWFLKANAWFTRFNVNAIRFGDQGLFVTKKIFDKSGGYNEALFIMEDQEIIGRLKKQASFKVINAYIITSARKYLKNGIYKTQGTFFIIWLLYYLGSSQKNLTKWYRRLSR